MVNIKFYDKIKEYGPLGFIIISGILTLAISYGSSQATASITFNNHESRIASLEKDNTETGKSLSRIEQKINDLWEDNGHNTRQ